MKARDNPFRTECILKVRYRLGRGSWGELMQQLAKMGYRAAVIGPDGSGKTTFIEDLAPRLEALGFSVKKLFLNGDKARFGRKFLNQFADELGKNDVVLLDGADLMGRFAWTQFKRRTKHAAGLLITSHWPGLLPTLHECCTTAELADAIVGKLLGSQTESTHETTEWLFQKYNGNLRNVLREWYDIYAETV